MNEVNLPFSGCVFLRESISVLTAFKTKMISVTCCLKRRKENMKRLGCVTNRSHRVHYIVKIKKMAAWKTFPFKVISGLRCIFMCACMCVCISVCVVLPGEGAATAKPLIFYISAQHILSSVKQHWKGHAGNVAFLWCAHFITEGEL